MVPVRPDGEDTGNYSNQHMIGKKTFLDLTFPSFAVYSDDVLGIGCHPLPHARRVFQHVPDQDIRQFLKT